MKVIQFPGGPAGPAPTPQTKTDAHKLHLGPVQFTCPHCDTPSEARFEKMIFRSIEFHCGHCGSLFKVINPGFANPPPKKK